MVTIKQEAAMRKQDIANQTKKCFKATCCSMTLFGRCSSLTLDFAGTGWCYKSYPTWPD